MSSPLLTLLSLLALSASGTYAQHPQCLLQHGDRANLTANCNGLNLTSIPTSLPDDVTRLYANENRVVDTDGLMRFGDLSELQLRQNSWNSVNWTWFSHTLEQLDLSDNNIADVCFSTEVTQSSPLLPELVVLRLAGNKLTSLRDDCFSLIGRSLQVLDLSQNQLKTIRNNTFTNLRRLTQLSLQNNLITSLDPAALSGLSHLVTLDLSYNQIGSSVHAFPPGVFRHVGATLTTLYLQGNHMNQDGSYLEAALADLTLLENLAIDTLTPEEVQSPFGPGFSAMRQLKVLDLSHECSLPQLTNTTFATFANSTLHTLDFSRCYLIHHIEACTFCSLKNLTSVTMKNSENNYVTLDDMLSTFFAFSQSGQEVETFDAHRIIGWRSPHIGAHLTNRGMRWVLDTCVRHLILSDNLIIAVEHAALFKSGSRFNTCVRHLDLSDNIIHHADPSLLFLLRHFSELQSLELQGQSVFNLEHAADASREAAHTEAEEECCTGLLDPIFESFYAFLPPKINFLNVSGVSRRFGKIPRKLFFLEGSNLTTLDLSYNRIIGCISIIQGLENLQHLVMSGTDCHYASPDFLTYFPMLKILTFQKMSFTMQFIAYNGTKLLSHVTKLETLDLSFNGLRYLPSDLLANQPSLRELILFGNSLENFGLDIKYNGNLTFLDLSHNKLSALTATERASIDSLVAKQQSPLRLHLQGNPLGCTCSTLGFVRWLGETRVVLDRQGDYPCVTDDGTLSSTGQVDQQWMYNWRRCVGVTALWSSVAAMLLMMMLTGDAWGVAKNFSRLRFVYTVLRRVKMPSIRDFERNAYVAYCDADTDFVCGPLKRQLHERRGVTLLIKDLPANAACTRFYQLPGDNLALNILEHIDRCWKVIFVLTPALTRDPIAGFMARAVLQSIRDVMPERVLLLNLGLRHMPELTSLKALLEAVPERHVFFLPDPVSNQAVWDRMAQAILH